MQSPNTPPTVTITSPTNGAVLAAPFGGTVRANAFDTDGSISRVEFFAGATPLGSVSSEPFDLVVTNLGAGAHARMRLLDNTAPNRAGFYRVELLPNPFTRCPIPE